MIRFCFHDMPLLVRVTVKIMLEKEDDIFLYKVGGLFPIVIWSEFQILETTTIGKTHITVINFNYRGQVSVYLKLQSYNWGVHRSVFCFFIDKHPSYNK